MEHKFKVDDRVRVTQIDDVDYYGQALYQVGDAGTVVYSDRELNDTKNGYLICFDRLNATDEDPNWWALEHWLEPENLVMVFE